MKRKQKQKSNSTLRSLGPWPEEGGTNLGIAYSEDGKGAYYLIVHESEAVDLTYTQALAWAKKLSAGKHKDFSLPTRGEAWVLYAHNSALFKTDWYWTATQHAADDDFAWMQYFGNRLQNYNHKSNKYRARAVRRVPI